MCQIHRRIGRIDSEQVGVRIIIGAAVEVNILSSGVAAEPAAFNFAHVPDQAEQRQFRRFDRSHCELVEREPITFHQQRGAMKIHPLVQRQLFLSETIRLDARWDVGRPGERHSSDVTNAV